MGRSIDIGRKKCYDHNRIKKGERTTESPILMSFFLVVRWIRGQVSLTRNQNICKVEGYGSFVYEKKYLYRILTLSICLFLVSFSLGCPKDIEFDDRQNDYYHYVICTYPDGRQEAHMQTLKKEGFQNEFFIVPQYLDGIPIRYVATQWPGGTLFQKVYILADLDKKPDYRSYSNCKFLKQVFFIRSFPFEHIYDMEYVRSNLRDDYSINHIANVSYYHNYENAENDGYYWIDDQDGERIQFPPPFPEREGYNFDGWYKEPECVNPWNFEEDKVPAKEYDEDGAYLYRETKLYAKWKIE